MRVACLWFQEETDTSIIAEALLRLSPQISVRKGRAIFVEIGKCRRLYSEESFRLRAKVILRRFGVEASIGIGSNIHQALIIAKFGGKRPLDTLYDYADPFATDPDSSKAVARMIDALEALGVHDLESFRAIPLWQFPSRFGALGSFCRQRVNDGAGEESDFAWPHWEPAEKIEERIELAHEDLCGSIEPLLFHSRTLLDRIFSRLKGRGLRLMSMKLEVRIEKYSTIKNPSRVWKFDFMLPHGSAQAVLPVIQERLARDIEKQPFESLALSIRYEVLETAPGYSAQKNLFHERDEQQERFHSAIEHLSESLGKGRVFQVVTQEERIPEKSWSKRAHAGEKCAELEGRIPLRPTRLFPSPQRVEIRLEKLVFKNREFKIKNWSRVEKISTGWLDTLKSRDYFRLDVESGPALWIFRDAQSDYYLHGYFE